MFLNTTDTNFILMTDKLGRYALTGESKSQAKTNASKYFRLVTFCSSSMTSNDFNLRIYCIDNLKWALQEVLRDEKKIGGTILETSEPFLISHSKISESLSICVDSLNSDFFKCKYNVTSQEIPLSHIWNGRNHLLHCSFTIEKCKDSLSCGNFECLINTYQINRAISKVNLDIKMSVRYNLAELDNNDDSFTENLLKGLKNWSFSNSSIYSPSQLINPLNCTKNYFK